MRIILLIIFISFSSFAQVSSKIDITISIKGKKQTLKCSLGSNNYEYSDIKMDIYTCKKGKEKFLIKYTPDYQYWDGVQISSDKKLNSISVLKVKKQGELVFKAEDFSKNNTRPSDLRHQYEDLDNIKYNMSEMMGDSSKLTKEVLALRKDINNEIENESNRIEVLLENHEDVEIVTTSGKKITCSRGQNKANSSCLFYKCSNITDNGSLFQVSLRNIGLNQSGTRPYLIAANNQGLGPDLEIKSMSIDGEKYYEMNKPLEPLPGSGYIPEFLKKSTISYLTLTNPIDSMYRRTEINNCAQDSEVVKLENTIKDALNISQNKADEIKMIEVVRLVNNGLERAVIPESEITKGMCRIDGDVYASSRKDSFEIERKIAGMSSKAKAISLKDLEKISKFALEQEDIPYGYYLDGCFARAHTLAARIENTFGVETEKIWAIGDTSAPNDRKSVWNYHVAPKLNVLNDDGSTTSYVLDPSVSKTPLKEEDWLKKIIVNPKAKQMKISWPPVANTGAVKNIKITYSPNEVYRMDQRYEDLTEEIMKRNDENARESNELYLRYLNEK